MSNAFSQKKVYHSFIKKHGPIVIKWKGPPRISDFDNYYIIYFEVRGDPESGYYYHIENDAIYEQLKDVEKNEWFLVTADGTQDSAVLDHSTPTAGADVDRNTSPIAPYRTTEANFFGESLTSDYLAAVLAAEEYVVPTLIGAKKLTEYEVAHLTKDVAASLFIQFHMQRGLSPLTDSQKGEPVVVEDKDAYVAAASGHFKIIRDTLDEFIIKRGTAHDGKKLKPVIDSILAFLEDGGSRDDAVKIIRWTGAELDHQMVGIEPDDDGLPEDDLPF